MTAMGRGWITFFGAAALLTGCGASDADETQSPDDAIAADLFEEFGEAEAFKTWTTVPEGLSNPDDLAVSGDHSSAWVLIYANDTAASALSDWQGSMPAGGVLVKAQYNDDTGETLSGYTLMAKVAGYTSESGDWFWATYAPDGTVNQAGQVGYCVSCHASSANDYIRTEF